MILLIRSFLLRVTRLKTKSIGIILNHFGFYKNFYNSITLDLKNKSSSYKLGEKLRISPVCLSTE